jgi:hypothetical protein
MPIILATQEAEIRRRIAIWNQPWQIVHEIVPRKTHHQKGWQSGSSLSPSIGGEGRI